MNDTKSNKSFRSQYLYFDWDFIETFNHYAFCLEMLCLYTMLSPILSIIFPILMLFVPLIILRFRGANITFKSYTEFLKKTLKNHTLGVFFTDFSQLTLYQTVYTGFSVFIFFFNVYQNILTCLRFNNNIKEIQDNIDLVKNYIYNISKKVKHFIQYTKDLPSYGLFNDKLESVNHQLNNYYNEIKTIKPFERSISKFFEIGEIMKQYYFFYDDVALYENLLYSFGFLGFIDNLEGIQKNITNKSVNFCKFTKKYNTFNQLYYPFLKNEDPIKNNVKLDNNIIITGPNAAGKTTIIKSVIINTILSQQIGLGFYKKAKIHPYQYMHCYINIPDTSGRDSLFQAEARRCKNIIDVLSNKNDSRHLCILDELYSGTNPYEAVSGGYAYINYLNKYKNFNFILTTHFIDLCEKFDNHKNINNFYMNASLDDNKMNYTYKIKSGISKIKGGIQVLRELGYPEEIIKESSYILENL